MAITSKSTSSASKPQATSKAKSQIALLENSRSSPAWLLSLCQMERRFTVLTWLLIAAMLAVYGWTVYSQQKWNQAYRRLETLQLHERQLMSTNEVLKNKLALQAQQPDIGLIPPNPATAIVLQPVAHRPARVAESMHLTTKLASEKSRLTRFPTGY